jgi:hypothetical protein
MSLKYDYYNTNIKNTYEKDVLNNGYIKIPFQNNKSTIQPNLILPNNDKYKTENIYIYKKNLGLDKNMDYDGELIIEHTPITNSDNKVYVCILLKTRSGVDEETDIDKLIHKSFPNQMNLNLNEIFKNMNSSCLVNKSNDVFIFKTPLLIRSYFDEFSDIENPLFSVIIKNQLNSIETTHIDSSSSSKEGFTEGLSQEDLQQVDSELVTGLNNMYIDCSPVDSVGNKIETGTTEMVPVNSDSLLNPSTVIFMSTVQNFFIFIVLIIVIAAVVPNIYKYVIMKFIETNYSTEPNKNSYLLVFDYIILSVIFIVAFGVLISGINHNNQLETTMGVLLFLCFTLSIVIMTILKFMKKDYYNFIDDIDSIGQKSGSFSGKLIEIFFDIFKRFFTYFFIVFGDGWNLMFLLLFELFNLLFSHYYFHYDITNTNENGGYYLFSTCVVIIASMAIIRAFDSDL